MKLAETAERKSFLFLRKLFGCRKWKNLVVVQLKIGKKAGLSVPKLFKKGGHWVISLNFYACNIKKRGSLGTSRFKKGGLLTGTCCVPNIGVPPPGDEAISFPFINQKEIFPWP